MNWRKGFLRVCIVLACLWTLGMLISWNSGAGGFRLLAAIPGIAAGWVTVFVVYWTVIWVVKGFSTTQDEPPRN